nr:reverse transcriptase [Tanacetum cinerariifolium]
VELIVDPHIRENPRKEDEEQDNEEPQQHNLDNFVLERDRVKRTTAIPVRKCWVGSCYGGRDEFFKEESYLEDGRSTTWSEAGIDYNNVFSPVVRHTSIRMILLLTTWEDYELEHLDVKTVFLHVNLEETIYIRQSHGFEEGTRNKDGPSSDWDMERISKVSYANVVGVMYGKDQGKHMDVNGFVNAYYAKDPNRAIVESKEIEVEKIGTEPNAADTFTKVVPRLKFKYYMETLCVGAN